MKRFSKNFLILLSAVTLLLCTVVTASAAGSVTYDGSAQKFIYAPGSEYSPSDLFSELKGAMPGDTLVQPITVKNDVSNEVKVNIYVRSLGAREDSADFLSQLHLKVAKAENNEMAYMFDAAADQTDGMTEWVYLGTLYSGGEVNLELQLEIPLELGDEYQNAIGYIDWEFKVEELPVEPDDPTPPPAGDYSNLFLYAALICLSGILLFFVISKRRREANQY